MTETYKPGDEVPKSGIYKVTHDPNHTHEEHEVTCVIGEPFPPCNHCGHHPRFQLVRAAHHLKNHKYFK
ncbi:MAG: YjzC family protein [Acidobacteriia bacterium]|nr:YjzC family protein [Terriglobia bacterium]